MKRQLANTATVTRTGGTVLERTVPSFDMQRAAPKYTIFEMIDGPNDKRFVPFNDMPDINSKFNRE